MFSINGILLLAVVNVATVFGSEARLKLVHAIFRHGNRTPEAAETYPEDPYSDYTYYPDGRGGLTNGGKLREYHLGQVLKSRYGDFLGDVYYPTAVEARSSDMDRTKMSLQLVLSALYPPTAIQTWNKDLPWQPIPTIYRPIAKDSLFFSEDCPQYIAEYNRVVRSPKVQAKMARFQDLMTSIGAYTGLEITNTYTLYDLYHTFDAQVSAGVPLQDWVYKFYPDGELRNATVFQYEIMSYNDKLKRIYGGTLLSKILNDVSSLRNGTLEKGRKLFLYSGHEINVASLQLTLGVYQSEVPAYSSAVIIEVWERDDEYFIKVLYHTGIPSKVITQKIPGCKELCPLDKFIKILKPVTATTYDLECV